MPNKPSNTKLERGHSKMHPENRGPGEHVASGLSQHKNAAARRAENDICQSILKSKVCVTQDVSSFKLKQLVGVLVL